MAQTRVFKVELVIDDKVEWADWLTEDRIPVQIPHLRAKGNRSYRPWQIFVYRASCMVGGGPPRVKRLMIESR